MSDLLMVAQAPRGPPSFGDYLFGWGVIRRYGLTTV